MIIKQFAFKFSIIITFACLSFSVMGQLAGKTMSLAPNTESKKAIEQDTNTWYEEETKRTLVSSSFINRKGDTKNIFSKKPIHYLDKQGRLNPINSRLTKEEGTGTWSALSQSFPTYLFSDGSYAVSLNQEGAQMVLGNKRSVNGHSLSKIILSNQDVSSTGCQIPIDNYTQQLIFTEDRIKSNLLIHTLENIEPAAYFVSEETITLPLGYELEYQTNSSNSGGEIEMRGERGILFIDGFSMDADILVIDKKTGAPCGKIYAPIAYDAGMNYSKGLMAFEYLSPNNYRLIVAIPTAWMNASERTYPITIDPLIGGPTSTWVGGQIPSCFMPAYQVDSLLATIPGGVTVTGLYVSSSFYADPFSGATMSQGSMYFSTTCGASQTFTVVGSTAQFAGTAYLDSFNVMAPLVCCVPESCGPTQIYVRFHLGRNAFNGNCNPFYIRYDPFTTAWPFQVVIYGKTPESYGSLWYAPQTPICSNSCEIGVRAYARYGVAPYTFSHPWTTQTVTIGTNVGCNVGSTSHDFLLTIPNCPVYCDSNYTLLTIPPPVITDACGTVITGLPNETVPVKPATNVELQYDSIVCSGPPINVGLASCFSNGTAYFFGEGLSGQGDFSTPVTTSGAPVSLNFSAYAEGNGCTSDTTQFNITVHSNPSAAFTIDPLPVIVGVPALFIDNSVSPASSISSWFWTWNDTLTSLSSQWGNTYFNPGNYELCLLVQDQIGCLDSVCSIIQVIPAEVKIPNVITPNNDGKNEFLLFEYLDFYPNNQLLIFNRWGNLILEKNNYQNDWSGEGLTDGTYFLMLTILDKDLTYSGFFTIIR